MAILIIDDSLDSQALIRIFLRSASYTDLIFCDSAACAFMELGLDSENEAANIDLIVLDVVMPEVDGIEACRRIRADKRYYDVPIIMVTANTEDKCLEQAFAVGASDYITKPLRKVELLARVRSALKLKEETDCRKAREQDLVQAMEQLEEVNEALRQLSALDGLTGIGNRRSFDHTLDREWNRAQREQSPLSLIMLDIDFFKAFNDTYGHQAGDDCLRQIAAIASGATKRSSDFVARYGGEEFVVVLPNTTPKGALKVAETIRSWINNHHIPHSSSAIASHVTVSLGVATSLPDDPKSQEQLISEADKALYQAKREGRNRVLVATI